MRGSVQGLLPEDGTGMLFTICPLRKSSSCSTSACVDVGSGEVGEKSPEESTNSTTRLPAVKLAMGSVLPPCKKRSRQAGGAAAGAADWPGGCGATPLGRHTNTALAASSSDRRHLLRSRGDIAKFKTS